MAEKSLPQIEIRCAGSNEFYFIFRLPSDGMFVSVFFENMPEVLAAIDTVKRNSTEDGNYLRNTTLTDQTYFVFRMKNKNPIGQSTLYENTSVMEIGIQFMKKHLRKTERIDLTT